MIDTLEIAKDKFPGSQISLDALCKKYRIDNSRREKHTAILDCELLIKVYVNLIDQKEPKLNFVNSKQDKNYQDFSKSIDYYKKIIKPTEEEVKLHKEFLKSSLKKNFY